MSEPSEQMKQIARETAQSIIIDCSLISGRPDSTWLDGRFKHNLTNRLVEELSTRDAAIEELRQLLAASLAFVLVVIRIWMSRHFSLRYSEPRSQALAYRDTEQNAECQHHEKAI